MTKRSRLSNAIESETITEPIEKKAFGGDENHEGIHKKIACFQLVKGTRAKVDFTYTAPDGTVFKGDLTPGNDIHSDMKDCLTKLIPHLINICEQYESPIKGADVTADPEYIKEEFKAYSVEGFEISGSSEDEKVSIFGNKLIEHGQISLASPGIISQSNYHYAGELFELIETCKYEAEQYLNGKFSAKQQVMDFDSMEAAAAE